MRIVIAGGGILGTLHAREAIARGHEVVHLEREPEARGASVRNFGLVWVSGRAQGPELAAALRARELWERIGREVPGTGFRACGSLTVLRTAAELAVAEEFAAREDAAERSTRLLDATEAQAVNPALRGDFAGALWCERDAAVEPRVTLPAVRASLSATGRYTWLPGREVREVREVAGPSLRDDHGAVHYGDAVFLCTGAQLGGLTRILDPEPPVRRVRLQMMQTEPLDEQLTTAIADADSLRYYPAYRGPALDALTSGQPQPPVAAEHAMQLLMVQRADGSLTIGDTHAYEEPFPFDVTEEPYGHLRQVIEGILGRPLPPVRRRWAGIYAQCTEPDLLVHRREVAEGTWLVTGPGGRGMTLSPALAEQTADLAGL
ncbi:TIGR03364 family FAD-dependent oxidoreductase [Streptomyces pathocidini]|uniref:TIGR03364 family FAD-dependent oxidoreductase n=1 Tax=Streptomyces pathocidini TaxID=1650571 RepID=A0ABW7UZ26_9ACTN|nr:TIGR03364 family FAD-dependent oxidoreductase [Streptomyces pathocidini]